jgi:hypothetical protein
VMSLETWNALQGWMDKELEGCRHLFVVSSIPVVYVNSNLVEAAFGFLPGQQDLEDDFKDQWLSRTHKEERLRLIHRLLRFSERSNCRVTIVSGDVHVAALGYVQSARNGFANEESNVINQLISSAIVHPPPPGLIVYAMDMAGERSCGSSRHGTGRGTRVLATLALVTKSKEIFGFEDHAGIHRDAYPFAPSRVVPASIPENGDECHRSGLVGRSMNSAPY